MPLIKNIREFNWELSRKGLKRTLFSISSLFTSKKNLERWLYLYTFILVPILNFQILRINEGTLISIGGNPPLLIYSFINIFLISSLIGFTFITTLIILFIVRKLKPILLISMVSQILILSYETGIIRKYTLSDSDSEVLVYLFLALCLLSILLAAIQIAILIYQRIRVRIIMHRELKN